MKSFKIRVCQALLKRDLRSLSDMNPFVEIEAGHIKRKTSVHNCGGKKPKWNQNIDLDLKQIVSLKLTIKDEGTLSAEEIGCTILELPEFMLTNQRKQKIMDIYFDNKVVGKLKLQITYLNQIPLDNSNQSTVNNDNPSIFSSFTTNHSQKSSNIKQHNDILNQEIIKHQSNASVPVETNSPIANTSLPYQYSTNHSPPIPNSPYQYSTNHSPPNSYPYSNQTPQFNQPNFSHGYQNNFIQGGHPQYQHQMSPHNPQYFPTPPQNIFQNQNYTQLNHQKYQPLNPVASNMIMQPVPHQQKIVINKKNNRQVNQMPKFI